MEAGCEDGDVFRWTLNRWLRIKIRRIFPLLLVELLGRTKKEEETWDEEGRKKSKWEFLSTHRRKKGWKEVGEWLKAIKSANFSQILNLIKI